MAGVDKTVLVPYAAERMFDLVDRVEEYPKFLPWCSGATILERTASEIIARLDIDYYGVRTQFTTANRVERPERIVIALRSGPFRHLDGTWCFTALGPQGSKVELSLRYQFATAILERLIGPVFGRIAHALVDAFVRRAEEVYGDARSVPPSSAP